MVPHKELKRLNESRTTKMVSFAVHALPVLRWFSPRFGANARYQAQVFKWLQAQARELDAEHVIWEGFFQSGSQLDEYVEQEFKFICRSPKTE